MTKLEERVNKLIKACEVQQNNYMVAEGKLKARVECQKYNSMIYALSIMMDCYPQEAEWYVTYQKEWRE